MSRTSLTRHMNTYFVAVLAITCASALSFLLDAWFLPKQGTLLILQLAVVTVAMTANRPPALIAGLLGAAAFNFLFTEPRYTLHMTDVDDIVTMAVFLIIAVITSQIANYYRTQRQALRQAQLTSSILLSVSHDLRTPLASIMGTLDTLQSYGPKLTAAEQKELLTGALNECHRLHRYIENLLQAARVQHGQGTANAALADVNPIVRQVINRLDNPRLRFTPANDLPPIRVRVALLDQALYNLMDNALRYSGTNLPVDVITSCKGNRVQIQIKDYGPGITPDLQKKIFDAFFSTRHGDSGEGGVGLGLSVAQGLIHAYGGTLTLASSKAGSVFTVELPETNPAEKT